MRDFFKECRALYDEAFNASGDAAEAAFADALFSRFFPRYVRATGEEGNVVSMLFSIPYPIVSAEKVIEGRYLYAVATKKEYRGMGHASRLLAAERTRGVPLFLRPSAPDLFAFYGKNDFKPFAPMKEAHGTATGAAGHAFRVPDGAEYAAWRGRYLTLPCCAPTAPLLSLALTYCRAVEIDGRFLALAERQGTDVLFRECLGDLTLLPVAAAYFGGMTYTARIHASWGDGTPFGVQIGVPEGASFLVALDG